MRYSLRQKFLYLEQYVLNIFTGKLLWKSEREFENLLNEAWINKQIKVGSFNNITMERMDAEEFDILALYSLEYELLNILSDNSEYVYLHNYHIIRLFEKLLRVKYGYGYGTVDENDELLVNGSKRHFPHIVDPSPWAYCVSVGLSFSPTSSLFRFNDPTDWMNEYYLLFSLTFTIISVVGWFCVIVDEATFKGHHTMVVRHGLVLGFKLSTVSEIMLSSGLFRAFFHTALSPSMEVGFLIPATGVKTIPYSGVPFYNTLLLCRSGLSISQAHWGMELGRFKETVDGLIVTIFLGPIFPLSQINEYRECMYNISDGAFPSAFYLLTGLHGTHVFIGLLSLIVSLIRIFKGHFTAKHHLGFLFAIWYWHFVDIVWIIVYLSVHVWISNSLLSPPIILCSVLIIFYVYLHVYYLGNPCDVDYTHTDGVFHYTIRESDLVKNTMCKGKVIVDEIQSNNQSLSDDQLSGDGQTSSNEEGEKKVGIFEIRYLTPDEKLLVDESDRYDWEIIDSDAFERLLESKRPRIFPAHWFVPQDVKLLDEETLNKLYRNEWEEEDEEDEKDRENVYVKGTIMDEEFAYRGEEQDTSVDEDFERCDAETYHTPVTPIVTEDDLDKGISTRVEEDIERSGEGVKG